MHSNMGCRVWSRQNLGPIFDVVMMGELDYGFRENFKNVETQL